MKKENKGLCILAGAGPGDIGLVTLRAREAVEQARGRGLRLSLQPRDSEMGAGGCRNCFCRQEIRAAHVAAGGN